MYCRKCGTKLPDDAEYCTSCGTKVVAVGGVESLGQFECPNCHKKTRWDVRDIASGREIRCSGCGAGGPAGDAEIDWIRRSGGQSGAGESGSGEVPPSPEVDAWLDKIKTYVAGEGYVEKGRHGREEFPGGFSLATAEYVAGTATFEILLFADYRMAERFVRDFAALPVVASSRERGTFRAMSTDRVAWVGHDNGGLEAASFAHWVKAAGRIKPPQPSAAEMQEAARDEVGAEAATAQRGRAGADGQRARVREESADTAPVADAPAGEAQKMPDAMDTIVKAASTAALLYSARSLWKMMTSDLTDHSLY